LTLLSLKRQVAVPDVFASFELFVKEPRHDNNRVKCDVGNRFELEMDERTRKMLSEIVIWFQTHPPDINRSSLGAYAKSMCENWMQLMLSVVALRPQGQRALNAVLTRGCSDMSANNVVSLADQLVGNDIVTPERFLRRLANGYQQLYMAEKSQRDSNMLGIGCITVHESCLRWLVTIKGSRFRRHEYQPRQYGYPTAAVVGSLTTQAA
jgi:hypothetical protein